MVFVSEAFDIDMAVLTWFELEDLAVWTAFTSDVHLGCRQKVRTIIATV